jgi:hypothetical protein
MAEPEADASALYPGYPYGELILSAFNTLSKNVRPAWADKKYNRFRKAS